jgi:AraC-like DNA-binding protein
LRRLEGRGPGVKRIHPATTGQRLNLSPRSLQRRLAEENTSLSAIVRAVRIREACHLLLSESGLSLTEIGYWCGFSDSPHFSREFRRALAMPPSVYRLPAAS